MVDLNISIPETFFNAESRELVVSPRVKKHWAVMLDLAAKMDAVCRKHNIKYALDSGSLLGAVRHGGFIPWDDDIDFIISREEYNKLLSVAADEFKHPYFFQCHETDGEYITGHAKLRRSDTTQILACHTYYDKCLYHFNQGVFLDLFVLDKVPDDENERSIFLKDLCKMVSRMNTVSCDMAVLRKIKFFLKRPSAWFRSFRGLVPYLLLHLFGFDYVDHLYYKIQRLAQSYNESDAEYCAPVAYRPARTKREFFRFSDMLDVKDVSFEFLRFLAPKKYDAVLSAYYGDWHEHVVGASLHGGAKIDLDRSYIEYL